MKIFLVAIIILSLLVFISCKGSDSSSANNKTNSTTDTIGDIDTNDNSTDNSSSSTTAVFGTTFLDSSYFVDWNEQRTQRKIR